MPPRIKKLSEDLAAVCRGRGDHAALVELRAVPAPVEGKTAFVWKDERWKQRGILGSVDEAEREEAVQTLFTQLRAWREQSEARGVSEDAPKALAAGGCQ